VVEVELGSGLEILFSRLPAPRCRNRQAGLGRMWVIETARGKSIELESMVFLKLVLPLLRRQGR